MSLIDSTLREQQVAKNACASLAIFVPETC